MLGEVGEGVFGRLPDVNWRAVGSIFRVLDTGCDEVLFGVADEC